jgi:hypothetical protein
MKPTTSTIADARGFMMAELLIATAIIGFVMAGIFLLQREGQDAYLMGSNRVETQQNARVALDLMSRELRSATSITALAGSTGLTFVWTDELNAPHTIQYALAGSTLNRTVDGVMAPVVGGIQSFALTYYAVYDVYRGTYTTTTDSAAVKVIRIRTKTEESAAAGSAADAQALMESTVTLRLALS